MASTIDTPEMAASLTDETIKALAMPIVTERNRSTISGPISFVSARLLYIMLPWVLFSFSVSVTVTSSHNHLATP